jgi:hypothetical protein
MQNEPGFGGSFFLYVTQWPFAGGKYALQKGCYTAAH